MKFYNNFFRFINQKRNIIIIVAIICAFIILLIKTLNGLVSGSEEEKNNNDAENILDEVKSSRTSVITDSKLDTETATENYNLIKEFADLCNKNNVNEAYNMLGDECKENLYPNIETFTKNYIETVFKSEKSIDVKNWIDSENFVTYLVTYTGDILSTGNVDSEKFQDYITIDRENKKLNVNRYIKRKELNKEQEINNIKFTINYVDVFKDYEIYSIKVENKNDNEIILDNLNSVSSTYLETNEETKINCSNYEAGINSFKYYAGVTKDIKLKFIKQYSADINDDKIVFSSAILDTENMENTEEIEVQL